MTPSVNVFVLNFNGKRFLQRCLASVLDQDYPRESFNVILIDNCSTDGSVEFVSRTFTDVHIVQCERNLGFGRGNNEGVRQFPSADCYVFLNNDTQVTRTWLKELVGSGETPEFAGSKSLFWFKYFVLDFRVEGGDSCVVTNLRVNGGFCNGSKMLMQNVAVLNLPYLSFRVVDGSRILLPFHYSSGEPFRSVVKFAIAKKPGVAVCVNGSGGTRIELSAECEERDLEFSFDHLALREIVQNAGSFATLDGRCGDRGFAEVDGEEFSAPDCPPALSAVSLLVRRDVFENLDGFSDSYFMYYEDTDLCLRGLVSGYKMNYRPKSVLRHIHTGTSREWSPFFTFQVSRSSFLFALRFLPWPTVLRRLVEVLGMAFRDYLELLHSGDMKSAIHWRVAINLLFRSNWIKILLVDRWRNVGPLKRMLPRQ